MLSRPLRVLKSVLSPSTAALTVNTQAEVPLSKGKGAKLNGGLPLIETWKRQTSFLSDFLLGRTPASCPAWQ